MTEGTKQQHTANKEIKKRKTKHKTISVKNYSGLLTGNSKVQLCRASIDQQSGSSLHLRSPGGSTVMFRYYLLGGDTAVPSGLYARLCHAFLVLLSIIFLKITRKNVTRMKSVKRFLIDPWHDTVSFGHHRILCAIGSLQIWDETVLNICGVQRRWRLSTGRTLRWVERAC